MTKRTGNRAMIDKNRGESGPYTQWLSKRLDASLRAFNGRVGSEAIIGQTSTILPRQQTLFREL